MSESHVRPQRRLPRHGATAFKHRVARVTAASVAGITGFAVVLVGTYWVNFQNSFDTRSIASLVTAPSATETSPAPEPTDAGPVDESAGQALNILLIGSDVRDGENAEIGGGADLGGMRSDTTMIMHISADRSRVEFLSIPRDTRVRVSDCKLFDGSTVRGWTGKFNIAFANGGRNGDPAEGAACVMQTLQDLTGITFQHYAVVDFVGFQDMINAMGGVPMCITEPIDSDKAQLHLDPGAQVLSGKTALRYARARYNVGDGSDLSRIDRQHELMTNVVRKALGLNLLTDAGAATKFIKSAAESLTMDPDLGSLNYMLGLAYSLRNIDTDNIVFETAPWKYPGDKSGDVVFTEEADTVFARIKNDIPMDGGETVPATAEATSPADLATGGSAGPTDAATQTPERATEDEILAECAA